MKQTLHQVLTFTKVNGRDLFDLELNSVQGIGNSTEFGLSDGSKLILLRNSGPSPVWHDTTVQAAAKVLSEARTKPKAAPLRDKRGKFISNQLAVFSYRGEKDTTHSVRRIAFPREHGNGLRFSGFDIDDDYRFKTFLFIRVLTTPSGIKYRPINPIDISIMRDRGIIK